MSLNKETKINRMSKQIFAIIYIIAFFIAKNTSAQVIGEQDISMASFQQSQDSMRTLLLDRLPNKAVKNSLLQELYLRKLAIIENDSVAVNIYFNLHGPDCGAPDCYSTDLSFKLKLSEELIFPKQLFFQEHEHGCVVKEHKFAGTFKLQEQTDSMVIYNSKKDRRTLIIFHPSFGQGDHAAYFADSKQHIGSKNIKKILSNYADEGEDYPYMSRSLYTNEYEYFFD